MKATGIRTSPDPHADTSPEISIARCNAAAEAIDQALKTVTNADARAALLIAAEHFRALAHRIATLKAPAVRR